MGTLNICQLPDLVLEDIALFLEPTDIVNLSEASTCFQDLRRLLPKYLPLEGEDFKKYGPGDGCFEPETYFDGPIMCQKIKSIKLNFRWRDQGYGNRKGQVWVQLIRNGAVVAESRKGDHLRFMRNIGGGGGHHLTVEGFKAVIEL